MVSSEDQGLDEVILQVFEEHEESFHFPVTSQKEARAFVKALHGKGLSYDSLLHEIKELEQNFSAWRKGISRAGIGNRMIERINRPLQEILLPDGEEEDPDYLDQLSTDSDEVELNHNGTETKKNGENRLAVDSKSNVQQTGSGTDSQKHGKGDIGSGNASVTCAEKNDSESLGNSSVEVYDKAVDVTKDLSGKTEAGKDKVMDDVIQKDVPHGQTKQGSSVAENKTVVGASGKSVEIIEKKQEAVTEKKQEAVTEKKQEAVTEKKQEAVTEKKQEAVTEKKQEAAAEKKQEAGTEKKQGAVTEKKQETVAEKKQEAVAEKKQEAVAEKKQEAGTEKKQGAVTEKKQETVAEKKQEAVAEKKQEAVAEKKQEAVAEKKQEAVTEKKQEAVAEKKQEAVAEKKQEAVAEKKQEAVTEKKQEAVAEKKQEAVAEKKQEAVAEKKQEAVAEKKQEAVTEKKQAFTEEKQVPTAKKQEAVTEKKQAVTDNKQAITEVVTDKKQEVVTEKKQEAVTEKKQAVTEIKQEAVSGKKQEAVTEKKQEAATEKKQAVTENKQEAVSDKKQVAVTEKKQEAVAEKKQEAVTEKKQELVTEKKQEAITEKKQEAVTEKKQEAFTEEKQMVALTNDQKTAQPVNIKDKDVDLKSGIVPVKEEVQDQRVNKEKSVESFEVEKCESECPKKELAGIAAQCKSEPPGELVKHDEATLKEAHGTSNTSEKKPESVVSGEVLSQSGNSQIQSKVVEHRSINVHADPLNQAQLPQKENTSASMFSLSSAADAASQKIKLDQLQSHPSTSDGRCQGKSNDVLESYDSDSDDEHNHDAKCGVTSTSDESSMTCCKPRVTNESQVGDSAGYVYVFTDSSAEKVAFRVKVGASRFPHKKLQQSLLFNIDMKLVSAVQVSDRRKALDAVHQKLNAFSIPKTVGWFCGPLERILDGLMAVAKDYPHQD